MENNEFALVYITFANADEARNIGMKLMKERWVACVNIIPAAESIYRWEGIVTRGQEAIIIAKTLTPKLPGLNARVRELHSYKTPAIVALPLIHVDADFEAWIKSEVENPAA